MDDRGDGPDDEPDDQEVDTDKLVWFWLVCVFHGFLLVTGVIRAVLK